VLSFISLVFAAADIVAAERLIRKAYTVRLDFSFGVHDFLEEIDKVSANGEFTKFDFVVHAY
jgi:hypothetical protein